ncbi:hypothetical protein cyc_00976 [Cyclospora cayetanensis]|uniref:Uncharacterized protein n=1 Tax=Cyclospora cayetanensis TaxID=88456 RepID=A0A1D3D9B8_9EIME|nr:hypothetical protein cyc_00976 [Cyclospora cayetanensis]
MAADNSLLHLEEVLTETDAGARPAQTCCLPPNGCSNNSGDADCVVPPVLTEVAARAAAIAAAAQAASLSERCRSLLPLLEGAAQSGSGREEETPADGSSGKGDDSSAVERSQRPLTERLELDSDSEGPVVELGVGVLDVMGQVPDDTRLAQMGIQVVELPEDSPVLLGSGGPGPPMDALQRALAARKQSVGCNGQRLVVSVLSSGSSSSEGEEDSDESSEA